ncbi:MAG: hypothetical protein JOY92_11485 [Verrucomicrobia bacterium]|nr:hypothetical protein [Verrucomicrobiota bacterium]
MSWGWDSYPPYVSAAEKRERAEAAGRKLTRRGERLQPIRIEGREIATTFWGKAWCRNLEAYSDYDTRLPRGRSYVRNGCVLDLRISPGSVKALVSGTRVYQVNVTIAPVKPAEWKALKRECAGQVGSLIDLLQGKLSEAVMKIITSPESGLFPKPSQISFECSCPDWAGMCKHVAATLYGVGARLDHNPELLFRLRGVNHGELIAEATESVTAGPQPQGAGTLAAGDVAEVFGIDIETLPVPDPAPARTAKRSETTGPQKSAAIRPKPPVARAKQKAPAPGTRKRSAIALKRKKGISPKAR